MDNIYLSDNQFGDRTERPVAKPRRYKFKIFALCLAAALAFLFFMSSAPSSFVPGTILHITPGMNLRGVSLELKNKQIIRSRLAFEAFVILYGGEKRIMYSDYIFENKLPVYMVARRIAYGEHHMAPIAVTIPEGYDSSQIADAFAARLVNFNKEKFLAAARPKEGYLFPDTYFFFNIDTEADVLRSISANYEKKVAPLRSVMSLMGKSEKDIIIMASLIERESKGDADRGFISGILWKRLSIGMALQADAAPETYKAKGLPKNPISNPGILAIKAAIDPKVSPYLYYLHDKDGEIHYAKNFEEHKANILKYLQ